jgi:hypothetical protein
MIIPLQKETGKKNQVKVNTPPDNHYHPILFIASNSHLQS